MSSDSIEIQSAVDMNLSKMISSSDPEEKLNELRSGLGQGHVETMPKSGEPESATEGPGLGSQDYVTRKEDSVPGTSPKITEGPVALSQPESQPEGPVCQTTQHLIQVDRFTFIFSLTIIANHII